MRANPIKIILLIITIGLGSWGAFTLISALIGPGSSTPSVNGLVEITDTIHVDGNWSAVRATYPWCSGSGTAANPYIVENLYINCHGMRTGILIEHTTEPYIIRNCTIFNAEVNGSAIWLQFSDNGRITGNTIVDNLGGGIYLYYDTNNISITGNTVNRNGKNGIYISAGWQNRVLGNTVQLNSGRGIWLMKAGECEVLGNNLKDNWVGIGVSDSNNSRISSNFLTIHAEGISFLNSRENVVTQNNVQFSLQAIILKNSSDNEVSDSDFVLNWAMKTEDEQSTGNLFVRNREESLLSGYTGAALFLAAFTIAGIATIRYWRKKSLTTSSTTSHSSTGGVKKGEKKST
nr:NosD domain-containing protein [Candidatus Sigynarchaeota archaeon]